MQDAKVRGAFLFVCLTCLLGSGFVLLRGRQSGPPPIVFSPAPAAADPAKAPQMLAADSPAAPESATRPARVYVDVAGAVRRPSLYVLPRGSRVMQALLAAGGPAADADIDAVNLAEPVTDGEKVFVPKLGAVPAAAQIPLAAASAGKTAPAALPAKPAKAGKSSGGKGAGSRSSKISADSGEQIGLNSATLEELERLPGVGPSMAAKILAYRQQSGGFAKIDDLSLVPGIGPKKLAKLTPFLTLN